MKLRKLTFLIAVACLTLMASALLAQGVFFYGGNVDPSILGSSGPGTAWTLNNISQPTGSCVADPAAADGWAWQIADVAGVKTEWKLGGFPIDRGLGATIVARVKTMSESSGGGNIGIWRKGLSAQYHWGGPTGHIKDANRSSEVYVNGDTDYHVIRLTAKGPNNTVPYTENFDGTTTNVNLYTVGNALNGSPSTGGDPAITKWGGSAGTEVSVDDQSGNKVIKVTGQGNANTSADYEVYAAPTTADGLITFEFKIKSGTGPSSTLWSVYLDDANGANLGRFYGRNDSCRGRINGGDVTPEVLIGSGSTFKMVVNTITKKTAFYQNGTLMGELPYIQSYNKASGIAGKIRIESIKNAGAAGATVFIDDLDLQGQPMNRVVKLYFDENPTPAISMDPADFVDDGNDCFYFGSSSTNGAQDIYFDWITGTNKGAYAPGEENAALGCSLVPQAGGLVQNVSNAKDAPNGTLVSLKGIVTSVFKNSTTSGDVVDYGFAMQTDGSGGVRVIGTANPSVAVGQEVIVTGKVMNYPGYTDKVIEAGNNGISVSRYEQPVPPAVTMKNLATSSGTYDNALMIQDGAYAFNEPFSYTDGKLNGRGGWFNTTTVAPGSDMAIVGGVLKIHGGTLDDGSSVESQLMQNVTAQDCGSGVITAQFKVRKGVGGSNFWGISIKDNANVDFCRIQGSGSQITAICDIANPIAPPTTGAIDLTGGWDVFKVEVDVNKITRIYFNNTLKVTFSYPGATIGKTIGSILLRHMVQPDAPATDYVNIKDLTISPAGKFSNGANTNGLSTIIFGKITSAYNSTEIQPNVDKSYFYIDDGSGILDGTVDADQNPNVGIRCRPVPYPGAMIMGPVNEYLPYKVGDYIWVKGVMGVGPGGIRYFWTNHSTDEATSGSFGMLDVAP